MSREALLARTFVELADTLVEGFDVVEALTLLTERCVEVLDVSAAGLLLVAPEGGLRVVASSSEARRLVGPFELQSREGPFRSVHALPMRLRGLVIGSLNLFRAEAGPMEEADVVAAQALADMATIAVLHHRAALETRIVNEQLDHALTSRVVIEQARGMVAERAGLDMDQALARLRRHARDHDLRLDSVARGVIDGTVTTAALDTGPPG